MSHVRQPSYDYIDERFTPSTSIFSFYNKHPEGYGIATMPVTMSSLMVGGALCLASVVVGLIVIILGVGFSVGLGLWYMNGVTLSNRGQKRAIKQLETAYAGMSTGKRREYKSWMPKLYRKVENHEDISDAIATFNLYAEMEAKYREPAVDEFNVKVRQELEIARTTKEAMDELDESTGLRD